MTLTVYESEVVAGVSIADLQDKAERHHFEVQAAAASALNHAIMCGEALNEIRERVGAGAWTQWVSLNLSFGISAAGRYMRLAHYKHLLPEYLFDSYRGKNGKSYEAPVKTSLAYLRGLPGVRNAAEENSLPDAHKQEMKRLRAGGVTLREIGEILGYSRTTVSRVVNPEMHRRYQAATRARALRNKKANALLRRQERDSLRAKAAREAGGAIGESYSLLRRAAQYLHQAQVEAVNAEARKDLNTALRLLYESEDAVASALKVPARKGPR